MAALLAAFRRRTAFSALVLADNPVYRFALDETDGATAHNSGTAVGADGTYNNCTLGLPPLAGGDGHSVAFDGATSFVEVGGVPATADDNCTFQVLVQVDPTDPAAGGVPFSSCDNPGHGWVMWIGHTPGSSNPTDISVGVFVNSWFSQVNLTTPALETESGTFLFTMVLDYAHTTFHLYVNGVEVIIDTRYYWNSFAGMSWNQLNIGRRPASLGYNWFKGQISEADYFNYALSPDRVLAYAKALALA